MKTYQLLVLVIFLVLIVPFVYAPANPGATSVAGSSTQVTLSEIDEVWLKIASRIGKYIGQYYDPTTTPPSWKKYVKPTGTTSRDGAGQNAAAGQSGGAGTSTTTPITGGAVSGKNNQALLNYGKTFLGAPYVYGGQDYPRDFNNRWTKCFYCMQKACASECTENSAKCDLCKGGILDRNPKSKFVNSCKTECNYYTGGSDYNTPDPSRPLEHTCRWACSLILTTDKLSSCTSFDDCKNCQKNPGSARSKPNCRDSGFDCQGFVRHVVSTKWGIKPGTIGYVVGGIYAKCKDPNVKWCQIRVLKPEERTYEKLKDIVKPGDLFFTSTIKNGKMQPFLDDGTENPIYFSKGKWRGLPHVGFIYSDTGRAIKRLHSSTEVKIDDLNPKNVYAIGKVSFDGKLSSTSPVHYVDPGVVITALLPDKIEKDINKLSTSGQIKDYIKKNIGAAYLEDVEYMARILSIERDSQDYLAKERGAIAQAVINRVQHSKGWLQYLDNGKKTVKTVVAGGKGKSWFGGKGSPKILEKERGIDGTSTHRACVKSALKFFMCVGEEDKGATEIGGRTHFVHRCMQRAGGNEIPVWNNANPKMVLPNLWTNKCALTNNPKDCLTYKACPAHFSGADTKTRTCESRKYR